MSDFVSRDTLIHVLQANGAKVGAGDDGRHTVTKGGVLEVHYLPSTISRHLIGRFARKFNITVTAFWNAMPPTPGGPASVGQPVKGQ